MRYFLTTLFEGMVNAGNKMGELLYTGIGLGLGFATGTEIYNFFKGVFG